MDNDCARTAHQCSLSPIPSATRLVTTEERGVARQLEAAFLAGTPARHPRLRCDAVPDRPPVSRPARKPLTFHSKWF